MDEQEAVMEKMSSTNRFLWGEGIRLRLERGIE